MTIISLATLDIGHFIPYLDTGLSNYTNYQIELEFNSQFRIKGLRIKGLRILLLFY